MVFFKNKHVLVTGATGLVGRELAILLNNEGANVYGVSLDNNNLPDDIQFMKLDLRDFQNCRRVVKGMDFVFHVAGIKGSPAISGSKQYTFFTNFIQLNTSMIAAMLESKDMEWGVYTSTVGTYGQAEIFKEDELWDQMPSPNDWYAGWAKRMGEVQIDAYEKQFGDARISTGRPVNIYGSWDNFNLRTSTMVPSLIRKAIESEDGVLRVWGNGKARRDIIHARDVARALRHLVRNQISQPCNIGTGVGISIKEVAETIAQFITTPIKLEFEVDKPTGDELRVADITRLKATGFERTIFLHEGIKETIDWYINTKYKGKRYDPFATSSHVGPWS